VISRAEQTNSTRTRLAAAAAMLVLALVAGLVASADAQKARIVGKTKGSPRPSCTPDGCQITGQVTGFQTHADGKKGLFRARRDGRIVAWSIHLGKPSKEDADAFGEAGGTEHFGGHPTAGIGILRKKSGRTFRLMRASPVLEVQRYYGEKPIFTLAKPLKVNKGNIVALTTSTWLPAFSVEGQGPNDTWVASRSKKNCDITDQGLEYFFAHTKPHRKVGSDRKYACFYNSARYLYWAYFVPRNR
jgi:hypothetical protein